MSMVASPVNPAEHLANIRSAVQQRNVQRARRRASAARLTQRDFTVALHELRVRLAAQLRASHEDRTTIFEPLFDDELELLERQLDHYARVGGRLVTLHGDPAIDAPLQILRVNRVAGRELVNGAGFRAAMTRIVSESIRWMLPFLRDQAIRRDRNPDPEDVVVVVLWRAGFPAAAAWHHAGTRAFWHLCIERHPETLASDIRFHHPPPRELRSHVHCITQPAIATGGTTLTAIELLREAGVPESRIAVQAIIAAPEGIDTILSTHPEVRILAMAIDERIDAYGNVSGPGIGDVETLLLRGIDDAYVESQWIARGFLSHEDAAIILAREPQAVAPAVTPPTPNSMLPTNETANVPQEDPTPAPNLDPEMQFFGDTPSWADVIPEPPAPGVHAAHP